MIDTLNTVNPLREGLIESRRPQPFTMIIFGAAGDLAHRKLFPALYNLMVDHWLPHQVNVIGFSRQPFDDSTFRTAVEHSVKQFSRQPLNSDIFDHFANGMHYVAADFNDGQAYEQLRDLLTQLNEEQHMVGNYLF
jgi:glucose-6-phosphate 1-dehydrogenase